MQGYGPVKKTAHFQRNQKSAEPINPLSMQYTGECSIAEPSGRRFFVNASYTASCLLCNGLTVCFSTLQCSVRSHRYLSRQGSHNISSSSIRTRRPFSRAVDDPLVLHVGVRSLKAKHYVWKPGFAITYNERGFIESRSTTTVSCPVKRYTMHTNPKSDATVRTKATSHIVLL